jgi:hypothetical protein
MSTGSRVLLGLAECFVNPIDKRGARAIGCDDFSIKVVGSSELSRREDEKRR